MAPGTVICIQHLVQDLRFDNIIVGELSNSDLTMHILTLLESLSHTIQ